MDIDIHRDRVARQMGGENFVPHTGQHYDGLLGHGIDEYDLADHIAINLNVRGGLTQKTAELMTRIESVTDMLRDRMHSRVSLYGENVADDIVSFLWERRDQEPFDYL